MLLETVRDRQRVRADDVAEAAAERMDRQHVLRQAGCRFVFVLEEAVLRHRVCDAEIMRQQLLHLQKVMRLASVSLGIIPLQSDRHRVLPREAFSMFDEELVSVELVSGVLSVTQPREIAMYVRDFADLSRIAVYGTSARALIADAMEQCHLA